MKILITGAAGYIGGAVAAAARAAGHEVLALARNRAARDDARARGFTALPGDLTDLLTLARWARSADAVIHAGFAAGPDGARVDEAATRAMASALEGSGRAFVYTSGVWVLGAAGPRPAGEDAPVRPIALVAWRAPLEGWLVETAGRAVRTVILRPGIVYGQGGGIPGKIARGELPLVGTGAQRWAVVHLEDLAALYVAAAERAPAGGVLHGVAGMIPASDLVHAEGGVPPRPVALEAARASLGAFADALALDQEVSSGRTRAALGWNPRPVPVAPPARLRVAS